MSKEKEYYVNVWLRFLLHIMRKRKGFVTSAAAEAHMSKRVFVLENPVKSISSAWHLVQMIFIWTLEARYDNYECYVDDCMKVIDYTWKFTRKYNDKLFEGYSRVKKEE